MCFQLSLCYPPGLGELGRAHGPRAAAPPALSRRLSRSLDQPRSTVPVCTSAPVVPCPISSLGLSCFRSISLSSTSQSNSSQPSAFHVCPCEGRGCHGAAKITLDLGLNFIPKFSLVLFVCFLSKNPPLVG